MSGADFSVLYVIKEPTDYDKAWENGQQQYNHRNDYGDFITLVKPICYMGDTGKTGIVIRNINLMDTNALKMTCIISYLRKKILHWNICL